MFWFSFHLLLKFWVYSKAERRNQGITLCYSSYIQLTDHDSLSLWGCLWKAGSYYIITGTWGLYRYIYTQRFYWRYCFSHRIYIWDNIPCRIRIFPGLASVSRTKGLQRGKLDCIRKVCGELLCIHLILCFITYTYSMCVFAVSNKFFKNSPKKRPKKNDGKTKINKSKY